MRISDFANEKYKPLVVTDYLICAIAYLLHKNIDTRTEENTLVIFFDDFIEEPWFSSINELIKARSLKTARCSYSDYKAFVELISESIRTYSKSNDVFLDYSSMPRSWYCGFPLLLEKKQVLLNDIVLHFMYVAGDYPEKYSACGIGSLRCFVGQMLPYSVPNKTHVIALGYDVDRTQSLITKLEPNSLLACYAYTSENSKKQVEEVNEDILRRATASIALPLNDFELMIKCLDEEITEQTRYGQVVIIPDGPKPLILALSMVSLINVEKKREVVCLHVSRNDHMVDKEKVRVTAIEDKIYCVALSLNA